MYMVLLIEFYYIITIAVREWGTFCLASATVIQHSPLQGSWHWPQPWLRSWLWFGYGVGRDPHHDHSQYFVRDHNCYLVRGPFYSEDTASAAVWRHPSAHNSDLGRPCPQPNPDVRISSASWTSSRSCAATAMLPQTTLSTATAWEDKRSSQHALMPHLLAIVALPRHAPTRLTNTLTFDWYFRWLYWAWWWKNW